MSTEATGDGSLEAVGAAEPEPGTENATPAADESDAAGESGEADEAGEADESEAHGDPDESDAPDDDYGEYADDEPPEPVDDDEALEYDEGDEGDGSYASYEPGDAAGAPRARRWPRLLLAGGFVVLAAAIVAGAIAIVGTLTHGFKKPVKVTYKTSAVFKLKTGDCFNSTGAQSYSLVSCDAPHEAEVFATFPLTGAAWPGATAIQSEASRGCATRLTGYVNPQLAISLTSTYVYPDSVAWQAGTRTVICEVRASSGQLTGSVRGATASAG
jgi:hypothetical protein